jgi:protein-S-isoprenylcysteine O-methyltransferase Ste14
MVQPCPSVRKVAGFRSRGFLGAAIFFPVAVMCLFSQPLSFVARPAARLLDAAGWMFFLLSVTWRLWATLFIGGRKDRALQTDGPYSVCRNPLYFGSFCYSLSLACFLKSVTFGAAVLAMFTIYCLLVIRAEEHSLELRFGEDFRNYCRRTSRLWPRWSSFHTPDHVRVDLKGLKQECIRLARAAVLPLTLQVVMQLRLHPTWPHWFNLP